MGFPQSRIIYGKRKMRIDTAFDDFDFDCH